MFRQFFHIGGRDGFPINQPFQRKAGHHRLQFTPGGPLLIVSFDHAGRPGEGAFEGRSAWGEKFYLSEGHALLGVIARQAVWYRDAVLISALERLRDEGFFRAFGKVVMTGGSMGGFGAATFAGLAPGCTVISFSPQATLDPKFVPWESRFRDGQAQNWALPYSFAGAGLEHAGKALIFTDPLDRADRQHARMMMQSDNVEVLPIPAGGHGVQPMLIATGLLKQVTRDCIAGTFDRNQFLRDIRLRKGTLRYHRMLAREALIREKPALALRLCDMGIKLYPEADFREMKALALSRLGRLEDAFGVIMMARKMIAARLRSN